MKTILVELDARIREDGRLGAAADLARAFGGHLIGLQVTPVDAYVSFDPFGGVYAVPSLLEAIADQEAKTRSLFEAEIESKGVSWEYSHGRGATSSLIAERSRLVDLVMVAKPSSHQHRSRLLPHVGELALTSSAPLLVLPPESRSFDPSGRAIIAWNGSPEASAAVRMALPMLRKASEVTVLTADESGGKWDLPAAELGKYLSRHEIEIKIEVAQVNDNDVPLSLLREVTVRRPAYLVMGAYGRSRAREWLLGGVTRQMLLELPVPMLLAH
ncbi:MAG: universal stress protein [Sphingomonadaceae bacterium]